METTMHCYPLWYTEKLTSYWEGLSPKIRTDFEARTTSLRVLPSPPSLALGFSGEQETGKQELDTSSDRCFCGQGTTSINGENLLLQDSTLKYQCAVFLSCSSTFRTKKQNKIILCEVHLKHVLVNDFCIVQECWMSSKFLRFPTQTQRTSRPD